MYMRNHTVLLIIFVIIILAINYNILYASNGSGPRIIVYGIDHCPSCISFKNFLESNGFNYEYRNLVNNTYSREYLEITMLLTNSSDLEMNDIAIPLTIVYDVNGYPTAIVIGDLENRNLIEDLLSRIYSGEILVVTENRILRIRSRVLENKLRQLMNLYVENNVLPPSNFIPLMLGLALADSINPCAISTTILLTITSTAIGFINKKKYLPLLSFIAGVYIGYLLLGFLVSYIISLSNVLLLIILGMALAIIIKDLYELAKGKYKGIECTDRNCLPSSISQLPIHIVPLALAGFGVIVSWTFMSCSAAPYFIFISYITMYVSNILARLFYLMIYCLIIVLPLIIVAVLPIEKILGLHRISRVILLKDLLLAIIVAYIIYNLFLSMNII